MKRTTVFLTIDIVAFVLFAAMTATGVLVRYVLPPGSGHFNMLWGMDRHEGGEIHFWIAVALLAALALHIFYHWKWILCVVTGRSSKRKASSARAALAVVGLLALLALMAAPFFSPVQNKENVEDHPKRSQSEEISSASPSQTEDSEHQVGSFEIRGSMTLDEIEALTGVSTAAILTELGLPNNVATDEQLGRLRRTHGFEMEDVRRAVATLLEDG